MSFRSIGIIDPLPVFRLGLESLLCESGRFGIAWSQSSPAGLPDLLAERPVELIISEAVFPGGQSVLSLLADLHAGKLDIPVLTYSCVDERLLAPRILHSGGRGYQSKLGSTDDLLAAIDTVLAGRISLSPEMTEIALQTLTPHGSSTLGSDSLPSLTNREMEVLQMIGEGLKTKGIAEALGISERTVDTHRSRIREKLDLSHGLGLISFASQWMALKEAGVNL